MNPHLVRSLALAATAAGILLGARALDRSLPEPAEPVELPRPAPEFAGLGQWYNSPPLTMASLRGKVVLVDFWTYSCINCLRTLPYLRAWADKYRDQGLVVIGVHSPEFAFEKDPANLQRALDDLHLGYPVAVDSNYAIWRAFDNQYWPAMYFVDAQGRIRHHQFGEGGYERSEAVLRQLLAQAGHAPPASGRVTPHGEGTQAAPGPGLPRSEETYLGYGQAAGFASPDRMLRDEVHDYRPAPRLRLDEWTLSGRWTVHGDGAVLEQAGGRLAYRFEARDLHLVLGPTAAGRPVRFRVRVDGRPPLDDHGADVDAQGLGVADTHRLYQLVRQSGDGRERLFEIEFLDPGVEAYVFTFG